MIKDINFKNLGLIDYCVALNLMKSHISEKNFKNEIWFLEHNPVYTHGTAADKKNILKANNIPIFQSDRGGEVTYHGPGQLVIYFLVNVKANNIGPKNFVRWLQKITSELLKNYSIESSFIEGAPGVYVEEKKIASIGLRFSKGKSYHGISLNVDMDLEPFNNINPCGYENLLMTQMSELSNQINIKDVIKNAEKIIKSSIHK